MKTLHRAAAKAAAVALVGMLGVSAVEGSEPGFLTPTAGDTLAAGARHEVRWRSLPREFGEADEMELLLSVDGGLTFAIRLTAELPAGSTSFRWSVPALASAHARLAVRTGREGRAETERIALLSGEFRIVSATTSPASLVRGSAEWWTEQALHEIGAESRLAESLRGPSERLHHDASDEDLDETPSGLEQATGRREAQGEPSVNAIFPSVASDRPVRRSAPVPLRE